MTMETLILENGDLVIDRIHRLFDAEDQELKLSLITELTAMVNTHTKDEIEHLCDLHKIVETQDVNDLRLALFNSINSDNYSWQDILESIAGHSIRQAIGPDYLIQSKINVSIQMPNDTSSLLPQHSDCVSGDSPWQMNLWIPFTDTYSTNSMFLITAQSSIEYIEQLKSLTGSIDHGTEEYEENIEDEVNKLPKYFVKANHNQVLLFNPGVLHGNVENTTEHTRVSLNVRIKSIYSPDADHIHPDRKFGTYYKVGHLSANSIFSKKVYDAIN